MNDQDKRRSPRLKHCANIRVVSPAKSEPYVGVMRDFSNCGLFIQCEPALIPQLGTLVEVQTTEIEDAPVRTTLVVRIEPDVGFGVQFVE